MNTAAETDPETDQREAADDQEQTEQPDTRRERQELFGFHSDILREPAPAPRPLPAPHATGRSTPAR